MRRSVTVFLLGLSLATAPACGRKGALVLPPGRAPMPVEGLTAEAGESGVILRWTNPTKEISGRPLGSIRAIEIWVLDRVLPEGEPSLSTERIERTGRLARRIAARELAGLAAGEGPPGAMAFAYALPAAAARPEKLAFAVRVIDDRRHASEFAGPVTVEIPKKAGVDPAPRAGIS